MTCICILQHSSSLFFTHSQVMAEQSIGENGGGGPQDKRGGKVFWRKHQRRASRRDDCTQCKSHAVLATCWMRTETKRQTPPHDDVHSNFLSSLHFFLQSPQHEGLGTGLHLFDSSSSFFFLFSRAAYLLCLFSERVEMCVLTVAFLFIFWFSRHFTEDLVAHFLSFGFAKLI